MHNVYIYIYIHYLCVYYLCCIHTSAHWLWLFSNGSVLYFHPAIIFISHRSRILVSFYFLLQPDPIDVFASHVASWDTPRSCGIQVIGSEVDSSSIHRKIQWFSSMIFIQSVGHSARRDEFMTFLGDDQVVALRQQLLRRVPRRVDCLGGCNKPTPTSWKGERDGKGDMSRFISNKIWIPYFIKRKTQEVEWNRRLPVPVTMLSTCPDWALAASHRKWWSHAWRKQQ